LRENPSVLDLTEPELAAILAQHDEPAYRARQIIRWVYRSGCDDFDQMTDLPAPLRETLAQSLRIHVLQPAQVLDSARDGTKKIALRTRDGQIIETVLMPQPGRREGRPSGDPEGTAPGASPRGRTSLCLSSQAGCAYRCAFCASGARGLARNLTAAEIIDQYLWARKTAGNARISNIVFMGMGEPLANYNNVVRSVRLFNTAAGISRRSIAISTCGLPDRIRRLADEGLGVHLAVSLHAPDNALRRKLMPIAARYPVKAIVSAARYYAKTTGRKVAFEYILMSGLNDSPELAPRLGRLLRGMPCMVNVISFNPHQFCGDMKQPSPQRTMQFVRALRSAGLDAALRKSLGGDISAACGQLSGHLSPA
jgi:23S rRNA (adenine2503-C2)-methyltransferase